MRRLLVVLAVVAATVLAGAPAGATTPAPAPGYLPGTSYWGVLQVAYRRPDGGITYDSGGIATTDLGGSVISGPATMALWRRVLDYPNGWRRIGGSLASAPSAMTPTGGQCPLGEGEAVTAIGADGAVWELRYEVWHRVGGRSTYAPAVMYSPKYASVHVFVVGTDRALWTASRTGAGAWSGFTRIGGGWTSAPAATELPYTFGPGDFAVVALGADNQLYRASAPVEGGAPWTFTHLP